MFSLREQRSFSATLAVFYLFTGWYLYNHVGTRPMSMLRSVTTMSTITAQIKVGDYFFYAVILLILIIPYFCRRANVIIYVLKYAAYYITTTIIAAGCIPFFALNGKNVKNCLYVSQVTKHLTHIVGIQWELRDMEHLSEDQGAVIVANHQSIFDILGMYWYWHHMKKCAAIAKKELFYFWPFGLAAWLGGVVFIDRARGSQSYNILYDTAKLMHEDKTKLYIFPEGTRNSKANRTLKLLPFKRGAFRIAISSKVPILPVVYSPYYFIDCSNHNFDSGKVIVKALPAISTENLTESDTDSLMERTRDIMHKAFDELAAEVAVTLPKNHFTHQALLLKNEELSSKDAPQ